MARYGDIETRSRHDFEQSSYGKQGEEPPSKGRKKKEEGVLERLPFFLAPKWAALQWSE